MSGLTAIRDGTDGHVLQWRKRGSTQALGPSGRPRQVSTAARNGTDIAKVPWLHKRLSPSKRRLWPSAIWP